MSNLQFDIPIYTLPALSNFTWMSGRASHIHHTVSFSLGPLSNRGFKRTVALSQSTFPSEVLCAKTLREISSGVKVLPTLYIMTLGHLLDLSCTSALSSIMLLSASYVTSSTATICLNPGKYALHIERWLDYFHHNNLHIIDGDQLKSNPVDVLDQFQKFLKITPPFDYSTHIRYDAKKGFFCKVLEGGGNKCLGKGKGRQYATMDAESYKYLREYYMPYNTALVKLLRKLEHTTIPQWLKDDLSYSST
ncbi:hypothetical protein AGLY_009645 [Aphis glycines]|uniref:Sulfotransferase domain-containing protein n=1 Tax=Aphis glycines TaxID=307491 RepID=A0A6G0TGF5_APHGL|nr:hypothetical protein AGLY_009645 [Aphis glycines]